MKPIDIVNCIERKSNHQFEIEAKLYLHSFSNLSSTIFKTSKVNFLQPTPNDILQDTIDMFKDFGIAFTKIPDLSNKQLNDKTNYTNKCVTCNYFSTRLENDYMCWLDLDVVFLQEPIQEFFKPTDKIIFTIYDYLHKTEVGKLYNHFFLDHIDSKYYVPKIENYVCTWFIYGPRTHLFWSEWKALTYHLIDISQHKHQRWLYKSNLESSCEEIASSILYTKFPEWFSDIRTEFGNNTLSFREAGVDNEDSLKCDSNTIIYHYNEFLGFKGNNFLNQPYKNNILRLMLKVFKESELKESLNIGFKELLFLHK